MFSLQAKIESRGKEWCHLAQEEEKGLLAQEDNALSTSSESIESLEEEKFFYLIANAKLESSKGNVSSYGTTDENNYYQLVNLFNELHEEARNLYY